MRDERIDYGVLRLTIPNEPKRRASMTHARFFCCSRVLLLLAAAGALKVPQAASTRLCARRWFVAASGHAGLACFAGLGTPAAGADATAGTMSSATVMLRVAEVTDYQERVLRSSAALSEKQRDEEGLVFARNQIKLSVEILLKNTKLGSLPGGAQPALTLADVQRVAERGDGPFTSTELLAMAALYARAREELRVAFMAMPADEQRDGKEAARLLRAADDERKAQYEREALQDSLYGKR